MELEDKKGWDINEDTFQGNTKELDKFNKLKADAMKMLSELDDDLVKVKIQTLHEKDVKNGKAGTIQVDPDTGLKRVTTVDDKLVTVQSKDHIQKSIDCYKAQLHKALTSMELLQRMEQGLKDQIYKLGEQNTLK